MVGTDNRHDKKLCGSADILSLCALLMFIVGCSFSTSGAALNSEIDANNLHFKEVIVNNDGFSSFFGGSLRTMEELQAFVKSFQNSTVTVIEWCANPIGSSLNFPSNTAELLGTGVSEDDWKKLRRGDLQAATTIRQLNERDIDPLKVIADQGRTQKLAVFASFRMDRSYKEPFNVFNGKFWRENQDKRIRKGNGDYHVNLSYAYPEVQQFFLDIINDAVQRDVAGINLDFVRGPPFFGYEALIVESYKAKYNAEPPPEAKPWSGTFTPEMLSQYGNYENWWRFRAGFMTDFLHKLKIRMRDAENSLNHKIRISARIDQRYYLPQGLDIDTWIREGLIDTLIVAQETSGGYEVNLTPFLKMTTGKGCKLLVGEETGLEGHDLTPEEDRKLARGEKVIRTNRNMSTIDFATRAVLWYNKGADGIHIFNGWDQYDTLKIIGDVDALNAYISKNSN